MGITNNRILYLLHFLMALGYNAVSKILPAFLTSLTSSALQISFVPSAYNIGKIITGATGGLFADWFGKKKTLLASSLFIGLLSALLAFGNTIEWYIIIFFFIGVFSNLFYISIISIATMINKRKARSISRLEISYQTGLVFGPLIGGVTIASIGMASLMLFWSFLMFVSFAAATLIRIEDSRSPLRHIAKNYMRTISSNPSAIVIITIGMVFIGIVEGARDILIPLYALGAGLDLMSVGIIFGVSAIITAIFITLFGHLADRIGRVPVLLISFAMIAFSFFFLGFLNSLLWLSVLTGIMSLGRTSGYTSARAMASDISDIDVRSTSISIVDFSFSLGRVAGAVLGGLFMDLLMIGPTLEIFFWASAGMVVIYSIILLKRK